MQKKAAQGEPCAALNVSIKFRGCKKCVLTILPLSSFGISPLSGTTCRESFFDAS